MSSGTVQIAIVAVDGWIKSPGTRGSVVLIYMFYGSFLSC